MNRTYESFLQKQWEEGQALVAASDLVKIFPFPALPFLDFDHVSEMTREPMDAPPNRYLVQFDCRGLIRNGAGLIEEASQFLVGVSFDSNYLRDADSFRNLAWLGPMEVWHPNIKAPLICIGRMLPGTGLVDLIYQCYELITYQKVTMREDDALNKSACAWARQHQDRFPLERRPLKRRPLNFRLEPSLSPGTNS